MFCFVFSHCQYRIFSADTCKLLVRWPSFLECSLLDNFPPLVSVKCLYLCRREGNLCVLTHVFTLLFKLIRPASF